jgi:hypothetical protein
VADLLGSNLICRDADFDVGTRSFAGLTAGEVGCDGARVVAWTVTIGTVMSISSTALARCSPMSMFSVPSP